jgi:hypothetical protein
LAYEFCISAAEIESIVADLDDKITPLWEAEMNALTEWLDPKTLELPGHHVAN